MDHGKGGRPAAKAASPARLEGKDGGKTSCKSLFQEIYVKREEAAAP